MDVNKIDCPKCGFKIDLGQRFSALVEEQAKREMQPALEKALAEASALERERLAGEEKRLRSRLEEEARLQAERTRQDIEKTFLEKLSQKDLEVSEKQKQLQQAMQKTQELELKLTQGSAQKRGIIAEEDLFQYLRKTLPPERCSVEKRGQGKKGTDVIVHAHKGGERIGSLIIDDKWATSWGTEWPEKIWADMQDHKADFAYVAVNPTAFPKGAEELKSSGFGVAPCAKAGVRVWVLDRSNLPLVGAVLLDTVEKIHKMADVKAVYGSGSEAVRKFQEYLTSGYETDIREKARHLSVALKSLHDLRKKFDKEYETMLQALHAYWTTEERVHANMTSSFGADTVKGMPQITFERD
jgi:hypothetical protein